MYSIIVKFTAAENRNSSQVKVNHYFIFILVLCELYYKKRIYKVSRILQDKNNEKRITILSS